MTPERESKLHELLRKYDNAHLDCNEDGCMVVISNGTYFWGAMHPESFIDMMEGEE
jgi:hypothetical protein